MSPVDPQRFAHGSIVLVEGMLDPHGRNPKDRPCVVVTKPGDAPAGHQVVVAISTLLPDPLPDDYVPLPWHRSIHPRTGLNRKNAAIGRWVEVVEDSRIIRVVGVVPDGPLLALAEVLDRLYPVDDDGGVTDLVRGNSASGEGNSGFPSIAGTGRRMIRRENKLTPGFPVWDRVEQSRRLGLDLVLTHNVCSV